jgi:ataxin-3
MEKPYIYFEKQGGDMMCGVHSINALLQGPIFNEIKMSQIGLALDKEEQELFGGGTTGAQARFDMDKKNLREGMTSSNVANDGNFSI